jgi:serine/threonine protein kinase
LVYAPPEQFAGSPASPATDVYAATARFYECLTGRPPFIGTTAEMLMRQHLVEPVPLEPVPEPLRPLAAAGLAKDRGHRPADGAALVAELRAAGPGWPRRRCCWPPYGQWAKQPRRKAASCTGSRCAADCRTGMSAWSRPRFWPCL